MIERRREARVEQLLLQNCTAPFIISLSNVGDTLKKA